MRRQAYLCSAIALLFLAGLLTSASGKALPRSSDAVPSATAAAMEGGGQQNSGGDASGDPQWTRAQRMFAQNDFAQASAAAQQVTAPAQKPLAQTMIAQIRAYTASLQAGVEAENRNDLPAAIQYYTAAAHIKNDGPGDPSARIGRLQRQQVSATEIQQAEALQAKRALHLTQDKAKSAQLAKKGLAEEEAGDLGGAMASLEAAQAAFPATPGVAEALKRLQGTAVPGQATAAQEQEAATAIRDFYAGQYGKAEAELNQLTARANAKWLGAAFFYLGAARLERAVLEGGRAAAEAARQPEVQAAFRQAHTLGYVPLPQFVSPALMRAWQASL